MADLRDAVLKSVSKAQSSFRPKVGNVYLRDGEYLVVTTVRGDRVFWRSGSGEDKSADMDEFRSRAVEQVSTPGLGGANYLDNVWQLVSSKEIARDVRAIAVQRASRRAPSESERLTVLSWSRTLSAGMNPSR